MKDYRALVVNIIFLLMSVFTATLQAQVLTAEHQKALKKLQEQALSTPLSYQLLESLTTEVGPRLMGTPADALAVQWAVTKMKALGFDKVWIEEVDNMLWQRGQAQASVISPYPHKLVISALGGSVATDIQGITAEVVHFDTLADLQAAPVKSLSGKIAFISYRMTRHIDGHDYRNAVGARVNGASIAAQKGAIALMIRSVGTDNNRLAHTGIMRYQAEINKIPAVALSNPDADLLVNQFKRQQQVRVHLNVSSKTAAKASVKSYNVIGEITGSERPDEFVLLGAHLDSWDVGTGAMDDGMGVSMIMAAAHYIGQLKVAPKRTIRVILFAGEEVGLLGAKQYVVEHKQEISQYVLGAEWDFGLGPIYQMRSGVGEKSLVALDELAQLLAPLGVEFVKDNKAKAQSDMSLLSEEGMPSIRFAPNGLEYFDYHHTENDTLDKINPKYLQQNTAVYTLFAYFAAQAAVDFRH